MSRLTKDLRRALKDHAAIDIEKVARALRAGRAYRANRRAFVARAAEAPDFPLGRDWPQLLDRSEPAGIASGGYFHQDLHVARKVFAGRPARHVDVGSRIDGFVAHVAVFCPVLVLDIRPLTAKVQNVEFRQADLTDPPADLVGRCESVSTLHALEHFGLGRYGDPIDPRGHLKGFAAVASLVAPGGTLYFSGPIGPQRVEFDAHRVWAAGTMLALAREHGFEPLAVSYVDDAGELHADLPPDDPGVKTSFGCQYGCGIVELRRRG